MTPYLMDRRVLFVASAAALMLLMGCSALPERPVRPAQYDFGPGLPQAEAPAPSARPLPVLALADLEPVGVFESSSAVLYRLAYAGDQQLRPYAQARWTLPPAQLIRQRLRDHLSARYTVMSAGESAALKRADNQPVRVLRLELEEFTQVFDSPSQSQAWLRLRATLVDNSPAGETLLAQQVFTAREPAASADAVGGVLALTRATDQVARSLGLWLEQAR